MGLSADSATKNLDLGNLGDFWRDGAGSAQKVDTLAGRRVPSTLGKRLAEARRASHLASLGKVMTHPIYMCTLYDSKSDDFPAKIPYTPRIHMVLANPGYAPVRASLTSTS